MKTYTTAKGDVFNYEYDIHARLIKETVNDDVTIYEYDNNSNKTKAGNITCTYDSLDRVLEKIENGRKISYVYDDTNRKLFVTDTNLDIKVEEYDKEDRLIKVKTGEELTEYIYNDNGSVQKNITPRTITNYTYYPDKTLKSLTTINKDGILIEEYNYEYDKNNNQIKENDKVYTYDELNRIKSSNNSSYTYDKVGNIKTKQKTEDEKIVLEEYEYNAKNELTRKITKENTSVKEIVTYTYDANGNELTETIADNIIVKNSYNPRNELIKVEKANKETNYLYNAEGKRIQKDDIKYVYDGSNIIQELDANGEEIAKNTYGLSLIKRDENYYTYNGHGDVTRLLNETGDAVNKYEYDEYGNITLEEETVENPYRYAGYYYDKETGNYYLQARYYNPQIQRFISQDTVRGNIADPLSLNLYTYGKNNPLMYVDPTGHVPSIVLIPLISGTINLGINFFADLLDDGQINRGWQSYLGEFAEGAMSGLGFALLTPSTTIANGIGLLFSTGTAGNIANQLIQTGTYNMKEATIAGGSNVISGLAFHYAKIPKVGEKGRYSSISYTAAKSGFTSNLFEQVANKGIGNIDYVELGLSTIIPAIVAPGSAKVSDSISSIYVNHKNTKDVLTNRHINAEPQKNSVIKKTSSHKNIEKSSVKTNKLLNELESNTSQLAKETKITRNQYGKKGCPKHQYLAKAALYKDRKRGILKNEVMVTGMKKRGGTLTKRFLDQAIVDKKNKDRILAAVQVMQLDPKGRYKYREIAAIKDIMLSEPYQENPFPIYTTIYDDGKYELKLFNKEAFPDLRDRKIPKSSLRKFKGVLNQ